MAEISQTATDAAKALIPKPVSSYSPIQSAARTRRQAGLFFGGVAFVVFSSIITRRSLKKRYTPLPSAFPQSTHGPLSKTSLPNSKGLANSTTSAAAPGYASAATEAGVEGAASSPSIAEAAQAHGPLMAVEALTLATMNVFSWAIMVTGGALWAFDIASMDEMRQRIRGGLGVDGSGRSEQEAEEDMEEWLATVLARKEDKERAADRVSEIRRNERGKER